MKKSNFLIAMALAAGLLMSSCSKDMQIINGTGDIVTATLDINDFNSIKMEGKSNVNISYGETQEVIAVGHENIIDLIKTDVVNGNWKIRLRGGTFGDYELEYFITLPEITQIENEGAGLVKVDNFISQENLDIRIEGLGAFYGFNMPVNNCNIVIQGSGSCEVTALENLDVRIEGMGKVFYKGNPDLRKEISGLGSVKKVD